MNWKDIAKTDKIPWTCVCGTSGIDHLAGSQEHQDKCAEWQLHRNKCFCRGMGGKDHEFRPQTPDWITVLYSCEPCGLFKIAVEAPPRHQATDLSFYFKNMVSPRLKHSMLEHGCSHPTVTLMLPVNEDGKISGNNRLNEKPN